MSAVSLRIQCACTALVALGAAYASYIHGRQFALRFGTDTTTASIWPLIVDGLLTTATVELWKPNRDGSSRWAAWAAFLFGISLSLCANIGSAPVTSALGVAVAACPPPCPTAGRRTPQPCPQAPPRRTRRYKIRGALSGRSPTCGTHTAPRTDRRAADASPLRARACPGPDAFRRRTEPRRRSPQLWPPHSPEMARGRCPSGRTPGRDPGEHPRDLASDAFTRSSWPPLRAEQGARAKAKGGKRPFRAAPLA